MAIRRGSLQDIEKLMGIIQSATLHMEAQGIQQWDSIYPNREIIEEDIYKENLFLYEEEGSILGFIVINEFQDKEYALLNWRYISGKQLVIHRLCIDAAFQGKGIARVLIEFAEKCGKENGYASIRLDAFTENKRACELYEKSGYEKVGIVIFRKGNFYCFEKDLREQAIIESDQIVFKSTSLEVLDRIIVIEHDKENSKFVYNWTKEKHIEAIRSERWRHITIHDKVQGNILGYILLDVGNSENDTIELTRIVIRQKGRGYGRESLKLIKKLCFEQLKCHRLWLDVFDYNTRAIELYKSEGFTQEGVLRDCKKIEQQYYSMRIFSMLRTEYAK